MTPNLVSIVIPARDQGRTLRPLLDTLRRLRPPKGWAAEIIPVYTPSKDDTLQVLKDSGMRYVTCEARGAAAARNTGVKHANGALLYFVDSDACPVGEDFLVMLVAAALKLKRFGVIGGAIILPPRHRWNPVAIADHWVCWFNWHPKRPSQQTRLFQPSLSIAVPRVVYDAVGGLDPAVPVLEDYELQQRIMRRGLPVFFINKLVVTHEPRASLVASWRHSWGWGAPFRRVYLGSNPRYPLAFPVGHRFFALNLPFLFWRRLRLVLRAAWTNSGLQTVYAFPFIVAGVFVWTLAVIWGRDPEPPRT